MKRITTTLAAALAALALSAPPAGAEALPAGVARSKNLVQRTVTIDDQTFRVTSRTEIFDLSGNPLPFEAVETAADQGEDKELDRVFYEYDAHGDVLTLLRAVLMPR